MHAAVKDAETLAETVGTVEYSDQRFSEAEQARISKACHNILNLVEPYPRADISTVYHHH